ncbi:Septal ring factor EnvC, activator of murein hydrolases AmiA and AmiB [Marinobacter zhejiangensis]|uniref:Septal ring factor EnvC, activator of murein hydrolases AmiA and AmiB n=2 Tax=Marinobacter zhejiangensis TaxID=488535 RepID=A0A1I4TNC0_9GAMM|nr:Septal ring factor EnvC, activator of murein hydrolases AmiA and AmiB [Marinobacter zhejiangensis]
MRCIAHALKTGTSAGNRWRMLSGRSLIPHLLLTILLLPSAHTLAQDSVSPSQIRELKEQIAEIDDWLKDAEEERSELEQTLVRSEQEISRLTRERRELRQQITAQRRRLADLNAQEAELSITLNRQRQSLRQQIRAAWMAGDTPTIKVLLNEVDPENIARTMTYYEYLSRDTVERLEAFHASLRALQETQQQASATQLRLSSLEQDVAQRQRNLESSKAQRERTLVALRSDINSRQSQRETLEADRVRLEKLLREVEAAIASIPAPNESQPFRSLRSKLPWPSQGTVLRNYGESLAQGRLSHNGLLLATNSDADVKAVHYGRVVFANWLRGFGLLTIVDHGDGYMSLYGHSSSLLTSPGDWVAAGQTIAIAGQTGGTDQPAVYFEIRHNGTPQNPNRWLARR